MKHEQLSVIFCILQTAYDLLCYKCAFNEDPHICYLLNLHKLIEILLFCLVTVDPL